MIPAQHFSVSMPNDIFDAILTAGAIGGEPNCEFANPVASVIKHFSNLHPLILRAFRSYPLGNRTYPTRRRLQYFVFLLETCAIRAQ